MEIIKCSNCGAESSGKYCPNCGQELNLKRFQVRTIIKDITHGIFHWENSVLKTFKCALLNPGNFAREYIAGRRKSFIKPFSYFLFLQTLFVIIFHLTGDKLFAFMNVSFNYDSSSLDKALMLENLVKKNLNYFNFIIPVIFAFFLKLFFKKTGINYAESFVASLYWFGTSMAISIVFILLVFIDPRLWGVRFPVGIIYMSYCIIQFAVTYKVKTFFKGLLVQILTYAVFLLIALGISFIYFKYFFDA